MYSTLFFPNPSLVQKATVGEQLADLQFLPVLIVYVTEINQIPTQTDTSELLQ